MRDELLVSPHAIPANLVQSVGGQDVRMRIEALDHLTDVADNLHVDDELDGTVEVVHAQAPGPAEVTYALQRRQETRGHLLHGGLRVRRAGA